MRGDIHLAGRGEHIDLLMRQYRLQRRATARGHMAIIDEQRRAALHIEPLRERLDQRGGGGAGFDHGFGSRGALRFGHDLVHRAGPGDESDQCTEDGAGICDMSGESGLCVECNADDETACGDNVCDVAAMTCTETPAEMTGLCGECVSDRQCSPGRVCVPMTYTDLDTPETSVGNFCLWREDADAPVGAPGGSCPSVRPYFPTVEAVTVSGETVDVCSLAVSTCPALEDFRMTPCTTPGVSDATCGTGLGDGLCRNVSGDTNRCTVRCDSDDDCRSTTCNTGESPPYCNF